MNGKRKNKGLNFRTGFGIICYKRRKFIIGVYNIERVMSELQKCGQYFIEAIPVITSK